MFIVMLLDVKIGHGTSSMNMELLQDVVRC